MTRRFLLVACLVWPLPAQDVVHFVFLEPVARIDTQGAEIAEKMPLFRRVADPSRYLEWLHNESADRALRLYRAACEIARPGGGTPDYYIALVAGGNHAAVGFRIQNADGVAEYPREPYILLDPQPYRFQTTLLHETGHMAMALVAGGRLLEGEPIASIPHSTAALSDRKTAFTEGYAIHLETLEAQTARDPAIRQRYDHGQVLFGDGPYQALEYFRNASDLTSYSQNLARYQEVRDNAFSFDGAFQGPDYLRVQLEKARDFSTVRDANQLLQSEGFYASFFFLFVMRGAAPPAEAVVDQREQQLLTAMHGLFASKADDRSNPWLLKLAIEYMKQFPDQKTVVADALNDLSHGMFVDPAAAALWKDHYLAALRLDMAGMNMQGIMAARKRWREQVLANPEMLLSRLGPEIPCEVPGTKVRLAAFNSDSPVEFDLNTVQPGIMRLIPGITEAEVTAWLAERSRKPFASLEDFRARGCLRPQTLSSVKNR